MEKEKNIQWKDANSWVLRVTINLCLDCLRRRKFKEYNRELSEQTPDPSPNPLDNCLNSEIQEIIKMAIQRLSEDYRIVILLRDMEGMSYDEISRILGMPVSKVKSDLFRGRKK
ncbi:MAG: RNA polymerase sigma factor [bacterium]